MSKRLSYREFRKILLRHDPRIVEFRRQGKGSHRIFEHPDVDGKRQSYPVKYHGSGKPIGKYVVPDIVKRFKLPPDLFEPEKHKRRPEPEVAKPGIPKTKVN